MFCWHLSQTQSLSSRIRPIADSWFMIQNYTWCDNKEDSSARCIICALSRTSGAQGSPEPVFTASLLHWRATPETRWLAAGRDYWLSTGTMPPGQSVPPTRKWGWNGSLIRLNCPALSRQILLFTDPLLPSWIFISFDKMNIPFT